MTISSTSTASSRKLRIAMLGCGRMGQKHALNFLHHVPRAQIVAVADPAPAVGKWTAATLPGVDYYTTPEEVLALPTDALDAVVISTITTTHAPLTIAATEKGWHVLLEKPISVDVEESKPVVAAAEARKDVKVMIGFVRRFDPALQELAVHMHSSRAGRIYALKSSSQDAYDSSGFFVAYSKASGGIFLDCGIHDIDMSRWLLQTSSAGRAEVKRVFGSGLITAHPELAEQDDCDNAFGIIEYANGTTCTLHLSRTGMSGYDSKIEVYGMEQNVLVDTPAKSALSIRGEDRRIEGKPTYVERFGEAFVREVQAFVECCLDDKPVPTTPYDALAAAQVANGLMASFRTGKPVHFDTNGEPIL